MDPARGRCMENRETLPELALGIADGEQRALALEHLAGCESCRRELDELSAVADELLALAPEREPPPAFEARVLERLSPSPAPARRRWLRLPRLRLAGGVLAGAAAAAIAATIVTAPDRDLATQYRAALGRAHGSFFQSAALRSPDGARRGTAFAYQGSPSWLFFVIDGGRYSTGLYREQLVTRSGSTVDLKPFRAADSSWGVATPIAVRDVALVRLTRVQGGPPLEAKLPVVEK
jgi:hypothetical protein